MQTQSSLINIVLQLVGGLPRETSEYVREGQKGPNGKGNFKTNLKGNIGRLYLEGNSQANCNDWVACSFKGGRLTREPIHQGDSDLVYIGALPGSSKLYYGTADEASPFNEIISPLHQDASAYEDSEYLLLNALANLIKETHVYSGAAYLLTERIPCASCTHVISEFIRIFKEFDLHIFYMFDSPNRNIESFKNECKTFGRVKISHVSFSNTESLSIVGPL